MSSICLDDDTTKQTYYKQIQIENEKLKQDLSKEVELRKSCETELFALRRKFSSFIDKIDREEEGLVNKLLTKLEISKKDKERIAIDYENEEECISNKLQDKLFDLQKVNSDLVKKNEELAIMLQRHVAH